jgi:hypothetical protein
LLTEPNLGRFRRQSRMPYHKVLNALDLWRRFHRADVRHRSDCLPICAGASAPDRPAAAATAGTRNTTAAFALTLLPGFRQPERSLLSRHDQGTALVFFLILGLVEEVTISHAGRFKKRIVAVCAAGLVAGRIISFCAPDSRAALSRLPEIETVPVLQGLVGYRKPSHFSARFLTVS